MWVRAWPHLRALLIAFHLAAVLVLAFTPFPHSVPERFESAARTYKRVREKVRKPFNGYTNALYLKQGWSLFTNPQRTPARLEVALHTPNEGWRTIAVQRSEVFDWKREQLDNHRARKLVGRIARRKSKRIYNRVVTWLAREAARDFPEADRLRVRLFRYRTGAPGEVPRLTEGRYTDTRVLSLEAYR